MDEEKQVSKQLNNGRTRQDARIMSMVIANSERVPESSNPPSRQVLRRQKRKSEKMMAAVQKKLEIKNRLTARKAGNEPPQAI